MCFAIVSDPNFRWRRGVIFSGLAVLVGGLATILIVIVILACVMIDDMLYSICNRNSRVITYPTLGCFN